MNQSQRIARKVAKRSKVARNHKRIYRASLHANVNMDHDFPHADLFDGVHPDTPSLQDVGIELGSYES